VGTPVAKGSITLATLRHNRSGRDTVPAPSLAAVFALTLKVAAACFSVQLFWAKSLDYALSIRHSGGTRFSHFGTAVGSPSDSLVRIEWITS
jgi:hypothetical protein